MATMQQGFPQISAPFVNLDNGQINQTWLQFLITLFDRTGGSGGNTPTIDDDGLTVASINDDDGGNALQSQTNNLAQAQMFSDNESSSPVGDQATLQALMLMDEPVDTPSVPFPIVTISVGASPFSYRAPSFGNVLIESGAAGSITITRGATTMSYGTITVGIFPLSANDTLTFTYTVSSTMYFIPA